VSNKRINDTYSRGTSVRGRPRSSTRCGRHIACRDCRGRRGNRTGTWIVRRSWVARRERAPASARAGL